jgi:hypothetical protein
MLPCVLGAEVSNFLFLAQRNWAWLLQNPSVLYRVPSRLHAHPHSDFCCAAFDITVTAHITDVITMTLSPLLNCFKGKKSPTLWAWCHQVANGHWWTYGTQSGTGSLPAWERIPGSECYGCMEIRTHTIKVLCRKVG